MDKEVFDKYSSLSGYLDKKQNMLISQKRFFRIVNGKSIVYSKSENTEVKGVIEIEQIIKVEPLKGKSFKIEIPGKVFELSASTEDEKINWVVGLGELKREIFKIKTGGYLNEKEMEELQNKERKENENQGKNWKMKNVTKTTMEVI